jgi:hypothetical protein
VYNHEFKASVVSKERKKVRKKERQKEKERKKERKKERNNAFPYITTFHYYSLHNILQK